MQTKIMTLRSLPRCLAVSVTPLLLALALARPGCAPRKQVAEIVAQSDAAMLAGQFGLPEPGATATGKAAWQEASDRIETFIAAHGARVFAPIRPRATGRQWASHRRVRE